MAGEKLMEAPQPTIETKDAERQQLAADIEAFLKQGGKITQLDTGESTLDGYDCANSMHRFKRPKKSKKDAILYGGQPTVKELQAQGRRRRAARVSKLAAKRDEIQALIAEPLLGCDDVEEATARLHKAQDELKALMQDPELKGLIAKHLG